MVSRRVANGLEPLEKTLKSPELKVCQRCGEKNQSTASYCFKCWFPLTIEAALKLRDSQKKIEESLVKQNKINPDMRNILNNMPDYEKTVFLAAVVKTP